VRVAFRLVDVFTEVPFAGNQLCVVPETPPVLTTEQMQTVAREIAFSETTFVTGTRADGYDVRIFTPTEELPFAGHPTLGTGFTMVAENRLSSPLTQTAIAGDIPLEIDVEAGWGWMTQFRPEFQAPFDDVALVARAAGLAADDIEGDHPMQVISTGLGPLLVPVRSEEALRRASRDDAATAEAVARSGGSCLYLFAIRGDGDVRARMFDAAFNIGEDPATGSAAGPLGVYLSKYGLAGMPGPCVIAQGEQVGRPSFLHVYTKPDGDSWIVRVGGGVCRVGEGVFEL